jgi:hypothetical protein
MSVDPMHVTGPAVPVVQSCRMIRLARQVVQVLNSSQGIPCVAMASGGASRNVAGVHGRRKMEIHSLTAYGHSTSQW